MNVSFRSFSPLLQLTLCCLGIVFALTFSRCNTADQKIQQQFDTDKQLIADYVKQKGYTDVQTTGDGISYRITTPTAGAKPTSSSTVTVQYKGYLLDGTIFDKTDNQNRTFALSGTIQGWQLGIPLIPKGGRGTLFIPSKLGYGTGGSGSVPANAVLAFDVFLVDFQ